MFVMIQCWKNLSRQPHFSCLTLQDKTGLVMRHAGVSITVTSITDVLAFGIGAFTVEKNKKLNM